MAVTTHSRSRALAERARRRPRVVGAATGAAGAGVGETAGVGVGEIAGVGETAAAGDTTAG